MRQHPPRKTGRKKEDKELGDKQAEGHQEQGQPGGHDGNRVGEGDGADHAIKVLLIASFPVEAPGQGFCELQHATWLSPAFHPPASALESGGRPR